MAADLTPATTWNDQDVQHLARRAGFGLSPEAAAAFRAANPTPDAGVEAWVEGTGLDRTVFLAALASADPVTEPGRDASDTPGSVAVPDAPGPHPYLVGGTNAWRNNFGRAQASLAFRMQYDPYAFRERMALFWHNFFATGWTKVNSVALMLNQWELFHDRAVDAFPDLLVAVSKDPAMAVWLDSVRNNASGTRFPNENYAREVMELYSLGVDKGYEQSDITELAVALAGWSFTLAPADLVASPADPNDRWAMRGSFSVYDGSPAPVGHRIWNGDDPPGSGNLPNMRSGLSVTFLGGAFNPNTPPAGLAKGEQCIRAITELRSTQCATFLARRLLLHFVTGQFELPDNDDALTKLRDEILLRNFDLKAVMKTLLKSNYFFSAANRYALVDGPVSWTVRAAKALGYALPATAGSLDPSRFPAWVFATQAFDSMGQKLLDPNGPNGWKEDVNWLNSNTMRYRTRVAAALALAEDYDYSEDSKNYTIFPSDLAAWFPTTPTSPNDVFDRLIALVQPAPIPFGVRSAWIADLWPSGNLNGWNAADQTAARSLAFLILCSPSGQLY
jgi:uncharacterized protein (DUF1800 family)